MWPEIVIQTSLPATSVRNCPWTTSPSKLTCWSLMVSAPLPTLESGVRAVPGALPNDCASTALISSELMCTSALGADCPASGLDSNPLGCDCCVACANSAIFWSNDWACSAMAAGACDCATGAGFFRSRMTATNDAPKVTILMMRLSFNFMTILERSAQEQAGPASWYGLSSKKLDDRSHRQGIGVDLYQTGRLGRGRRRRHSVFS